MTRWLAGFVHAANALVAATGLLYAWMRYGLAPPDAYAVVNHPWQPFIQHLHVWTAPLLVFAVGLIWQAHVWSHWRSGMASGRRSGVSLLASLAPMVASGYLLQTAVSPAWRVAWLAVHLASSTLWLVGYAAHAVAKLRRRRGETAATAVSEAAPGSAQSAASRP